MTRKILGILVSLFFITSFTPSFVASAMHEEIEMRGEVVDQSQNEGDEYVWLKQGEVAWQQFVPEKKECLRVEVKIKQLYEGPDAAPIRLAIEEPYGTILTQKELPANDIPDQGDWISFDVPDITLECGRMYYLTLFFDGRADYAWCGSWGDKYSNGYSSNGEFWDWCFKTYVSKTKSKDNRVPLPFWDPEHSLLICIDEMYVKYDSDDPPKGGGEFYFKLYAFPKIWKWETDIYEVNDESTTPFNLGKIGAFETKYTPQFILLLAFDKDERPPPKDIFDDFLGWMFIRFKPPKGDYPQSSPYHNSLNWENKFFKCDVNLQFHY